MTTDSKVCVAPVADWRPSADLSGVAAAAELPREVADVLRLRGVARGPVLVLTGSAAGTGRHEAAPQFQLTCGIVSEARALAGRGGFAAVVLILEGSGAAEFEPIVTAIAPPRLAPGTFAGGAHTAQRVARDERRRRPIGIRHTCRCCGPGLSAYGCIPIAKGRAFLAQRSSAAPAIRTCSILVPVFNEKDTFPELMRTLLAKRLDHLGLEREIILIESNSSDGTRELVAGFAATPGVRIIYEDSPHGKGHAVRAGLAVATGDIVLIQDADLEYDLNDYDALLEPLLSGRAAFVLGCRHGGRFRMRRFPHQRLLGEVLNVAHVLLANLINVLYRQNMKDPFHDVQGLPARVHLRAGVRVQWVRFRS